MILYEDREVPDQTARICAFAILIWMGIFPCNGKPTNQGKQNVPIMTYSTLEDLN